MFWARNPFLTLEEGLPEPPLVSAQHGSPACTTACAAAPRGGHPCFCTGPLHVPCCCVGRPSLCSWVVLSLHWELSSNLMSDLPIQSPPYSPPVPPVLNLSQIVLLISCFFEDQVLPFC